MATTDLRELLKHELGDLYFAEKQFLKGTKKMAREVSDPEVRAFWSRLSPYHALRREVRYPEPFIFTTTKDDRVGPVHARKFAARMKEYGLPYLFYENTEGGHAAGANLRQQARTNALEMTYLIRKVMD